MGDKPAVVIIGGLGFIGRHLAKHIVDHDLASELRIVDKQLPELAFLAPEFQTVCTRERCVQADAAQEGHYAKIFERPNGAPFTYVFNCGGEARFAGAEEAYEMRSYLLSVNLATEAQRRRVPAYVECSTGLVYKQEGSKPRKETDPVKPATALGQYRLQAAQELQALAARGPLNLVVLRFPNVYGPYGKGLLSTIACMARCFQATGGEMKWLWDEQLRCHTVHVRDAARALWAAAAWRASPAGTTAATASPWPVFNIVDHTDTSQKTLAALTKSLFNIPTGFHSKLISAFARMNLDSLVDNVNADCLATWAELLEQQGIRSGPIGPYMEVAQLREQHLCMDGSLFEAKTGFTYQTPTLGEAQFREVVESYKQMGWWPS